MSMHITRRGVLLGGLAVAGGAVYSGVALAGETTTPSISAPAIISCEQWGARPSSRTVPVHNQRPVKILVHHTATSNNVNRTQAAGEALARSIQKFHMKSRGWLDSGQHFTISRGGFILEGRHRSLETLRGGKRQVEGAHCTGQNIVAVGIENEGLYTSATPPAEQWRRLVEMCAFICRQYKIRPTEIFGHRDFKDTACPGDVLYRKLPQLRKEVAAKLGRTVDENQATKEGWPLLQVQDEGPEVLAAQHLLRASGMTEVVADGSFDRRTAAAVRRFQIAHATEDVNGIIGGESWPLLVAASAPGASQETARAVAALNASDRGTIALDPTDWKILLNNGPRHGG